MESRRRKLLRQFLRQILTKISRSIVEFAIAVASNPYSKGYYKIANEDGIPHATAAPEPLELPPQK